MKHSIDFGVRNSDVSSEMAKARTKLKSFDVFIGWNFPN